VKRIQKEMAVEATAATCHGVFADNAGVCPWRQRTFAAGRGCASQGRIFFNQQFWT